MVDTAAHLTVKQEAFVCAYLLNGFNATRAAKTAGYSEDTARSQGSQLLTNLNVSKAVNARLDSEGITPAKIKIALAEIAFGTDLADFDLALGGTSLTDLREAGINTRLIKSITTRFEVDKADDDKRYEIRKIELHDCLSAIDKLAKVHGMYIENVNTNVNIDNRNNLSPEELAWITARRGGPASE